MNSNKFKQFLHLSAFAIAGLWVNSCVINPPEAILVLTNTTPANKSKNVEIYTSQIVIEFNKPVVEKQITGNFDFVVESNNQDSILIIKPAGTALNFGRFLKEGKTYSLSLAGNVEDLSGQDLTSGEYEFTTRTYSYGDDTLGLNVLAYGWIVNQGTYNHYADLNGADSFKVVITIKNSIATGNIAGLFNLKYMATFNGSQAPNSEIKTLDSLEVSDTLTANSTLGGTYGAKVEMLKSQDNSLFYTIEFIP